MRIISPGPPVFDVVAWLDHRKFPLVAASQNETCEIVSEPESVNSGVPEAEIEPPAAAEKETATLVTTVLEFPEPDVPGSPVWIFAYTVAGGV